MARERWLVISNCQTHGMANSLQALAPDVAVTAMYPHSFNNAPFRNNRELGRYDMLFMPDGFEALLPRAKLDRVPTRISLPLFGFRAYHPDLVYVQCRGQAIKSPADDYHSAIALSAYRKGMSLADTRSLFNGRQFETCGLMDWWQPERDRAVAELARVGIDISGLIRRWGRNSAFMYSNNHPKIQVLFDIAAELVRKTGRTPFAVATPPHDNLAFAAGYAIYPEIGESLGVPGSYVFKTFDTYRQFGLDEFLENSFAIYDGLPREDLTVVSEFAAAFDRVDAAI